MAELLGNKEEKVREIKKLIEKLHNKEMTVEEAKAIFKDLTKDLSPHHIAVLEEQLIHEGLDPEKVRSLCDVHIEVFREMLEKEEVLAPKGHPIQILMAEHSKMVSLAQQLRNNIKVIKDQSGDKEQVLAQIKVLIENFREAEKHYLREENVLFPELEKRGITQPPKIMWMEHDDIRDLKKQLFSKVEDISLGQPQEYWESLFLTAHMLLEKISGHFYKENRILFPTALKVVPQELWADLRKQFDEIGYTSFLVPESFDITETKKEEQKVSEGLIQLSTGTFSIKELEAMLDSLPIDITFVDAEDKVRYFNQPKERFFVRSRSVIGRTVQNCHPKKSVHVVEQILNDFKSGKRDTAEFWLNIKGKFLYIRYFAVRSPQGEYLGTLEVTQDITEIRKLEGEKRIYDY